MSVYKIFILLVFNRECMERNVMTSFRIFFTLFQTEWSVFLPFSVNCSQVAIFQIMSVLCPHGQGEWRGGGCSTKCGQTSTGGGDPENSKICVDILYGWPPFEKNVKIKLRVKNKCFRALSFREYAGFRILFIFFPHFKRNMLKNICRAAKILKTSNILNYTNCNHLTL